MNPPGIDATPKRRTVLVVDDDPGTRHVMASGIGEVLGSFDVVTAQNGREATEILEAQPIDAIATDLSMPVMDGFSLIAYVSNRKGALPVVAFSGLATSEVDERLASYGGLRILRKPVSYQEVATTLEEAIARVEQGQVEGIPLASLLQLVELERRTCTVIVTSERRKGRLHFQSGRLIDAFSDDFGADGEAAAYDILGWRDASLAFESLPNGIRPQIDTPLQRMLLEVAAGQEERVAIPSSPPHLASPAPVGARGDEAPSRPPDPEASPAPPQAPAPPPDPPMPERSAEPGAAATDPHVATLLEAVTRLTTRVRDADAALAAVATEVDAFRGAVRDLEAVDEERKRRRRELEAFRDEVADLARALVERVDAMLGPDGEGGVADPLSRDVTSHPAEP